MKIDQKNWDYKKISKLTFGNQRINKVKYNLDIDE